MKRAGEIALVAGEVFSLPAIWHAGGYDATHKGFDAGQLMEAIQYGVMQNVTPSAVAAACFAIAAIDAVNSRRNTHVIH